MSVACNVALAKRRRPFKVSAHSHRYNANICARDVTPKPCRLQSLFNLLKGICDDQAFSAYRSGHTADDDRHDLGDCACNRCMGACCSGKAVRPDGGVGQLRRAFRTAGAGDAFAGAGEFPCGDDRWLACPIGGAQSAGFARRSSARHASRRAGIGCLSCLSRQACGRSQRFPRGPSASIQNRQALRTCSSARRERATSGWGCAMKGTDARHNFLRPSRSHSPGGGGGLGLCNTSRRAPHPPDARRAGGF